MLEWKSPDAKWFVGGKLNVAVNCVDRHVRTARRNKAAIIWEGEPGDRRTLTYFDLYREVNAFAHVLHGLGVKHGDRVAIYMPLIPELAIAMLACARIGAIHSVVFGGFSAESLRDRINDSQCSAAGHRRRRLSPRSLVPLKQMADEALKDTPSIHNVVVVQRDQTARFPVHIQEGRDHWYHRLMQEAGRQRVEPEPMDTEDMLYILYTSGTTGKPKGIVHTTAGYLVGCYATTKWVFDLKDEDVYWCTADIGWVTGHSYVVYGPLANGATVVMYEGAPDWPDKARFWQIVERYGVTIFYTAPTAIRAFMRWGTEWPETHDLWSLRLLGSVGEPINPEAWMWYHKTIGGERCPIVDTWWQTETGHDHDHAAARADDDQAGFGDAARSRASARRSATQDGEPVEVGGGLLTLTKPWPAMLRGIYGDRERFVTQYFSQWKDGAYFTGDGAQPRRRRLLLAAGPRGRRAERRRPSHRHDGGRERAGRSPGGGRGGGRRPRARDQGPGDHGVRHAEGRQRGSTAAGGRTAARTSAKKIGAIARPEEILFAADLPKTRSGKIMRRLLRDIAEGRALGDTTTLADPAVVAKLKENYEEDQG